MKTIYYAYVQKVEVPADTPEEKIDDLIFSLTMYKNDEKPADYIWSEKPNLFWED
jgi:hypothetical protein